MTRTRSSSSHSSPALAAAAATLCTMMLLSTSLAFLAPSIPTSTRRHSVSTAAGRGVFSTSTAPFSRIETRRDMSGGGSDTSDTMNSTIISPFDAASPVYNDASKAASSSSSTATATATDYLDLTWDNVEKVLDEMRPYLIQDGGNVVIADIDGPVVKLELQGACGTCPSSTQTLKMGLERGLKEKIPEIQEVVQSLPEGPPLVVEQVDVVLDGVRPFLQVVGGTIDVDRIEGVDSLQPTIWLFMQGSSASLNSVKLEIAQRLQRHFMMSGLQIQWKE